MKKNILLIIVIFTYSIFNAQVGIGITTPEGALDVFSTTEGFIPPRVVLTAINVQAPIINPKTGLVLVDGTMVYNINTEGTSPNNVYPGYYYWQNLGWVRLRDNYAPELFELAFNVVVSNTTYIDIPTTSYTFIAKRTEAIIELTGSGNGTVGAAGNVHFQVLDASGNIICSTKTKIQNLTFAFDPITSGYFSWSTTTWNIFAKGKMVDLIIDNSYTIKVQWKISNAFGISSASIDALTDSEESLIIEVR